MGKTLCNAIYFECVSGKESSDRGIRKPKFEEAWRYLSRCKFEHGFTTLTSRNSPPIQSCLRDSVHADRKLHRGPPDSRVFFIFILSEWSGLYGTTRNERCFCRRFARTKRTLQQHFAQKGGVEPDDVRVRLSAGSVTEDRRRASFRST